MTEAAVGRVLVASLHQAVSELIPSRLDFYEPWLNPAAPRAGVGGLAPLSAALSFLRREGDAYGLVATRAGAYAAEWTVADVSRLRRRLMLGLPRRIRRRMVARLADAMAHRTYGATSLRISWRQGRGTVTLRGSLFCEVRHPVEHPLCAFYATALSDLMRQFDLDDQVVTERCRATDRTAESCVLSISSRPVAEQTP